MPEPRREEGRPSSGSRWLLPGLFLLALSVRILHLIALRGSPLVDMRVGDSGVYDAWARAIAGGDWLGTEVFWYAPLYPYLLGAIYAVLGDDGWAVRIIQAALGAASCVLLADAARRLGDRLAGVVAGLLLAFYGPAIFYDSLLHKPTLALFLVCVLLWLMARRIEGPWPPFPAAALGAVLGLLVLTRENTLAFLPVLAGWILLARGPTGRARLTAVAALLLGLTAVLAPVAVRNLVVGGELHLTAANFGDNFYKGNNERADGTYMPLVPLRGSPRYERSDAVTLAEEETGRSMSPSEVSRYWTGRALAYIRAEPTDWLGLMARKLFLFWHRTELADSEDPYTHARWSWVLRVTLTMLHMGTLGPLALLGLWVAHDRRRAMRPLVVMLGVYAATVTLFYVFGRYRYPVVGLLVLFASIGVAGAVPYLRAAGPWKRAGCLGSVLLALVAFNWPTDAADRTRAGTLYNIATELGREPDRLAEAIDFYEESLALDPTSVAALYNLANAHKRQGSLDAAEARYRQALGLRPGLADAHNNLGRVQEARGDLAGATASYRRAVRANAGHWEAHNNLGMVLARLGRLEEAEVSLRESLRLRPGEAVPSYNLGNVLLQQGRAPEAAALYREALAADPGLAPAHNNLGQALLRLGDLDGAVASYRRALAIDPEYDVAEANLRAAEAARARRRDGPGSGG